MTAAPDMLAAARRLVEETERAYLSALDNLAMLEAAAGGLKPPAPATPVNDNQQHDHHWKPRWGFTGQAAAKCGVTEDTMRGYLKEHGLGSRNGRSWRVDMARVEAWLEKRSYPPIPQD